MFHKKHHLLDSRIENRRNQGGNMKKFFVLFSLICLAVFALAGCTPSDQTVSGNGNNNGLFHYYTSTRDGCK